MSWIELELNQECRTWEIELSSTIMSRVDILFTENVSMSTTSFVTLNLFFHDCNNILTDIGAFLASHPYLALRSAENVFS